MAKKVIVNGLNIGYLPPTTADEILYVGGGNLTVKDKIDSIIQPPNLSNITRESLTSGTFTEITSTGQWYCVRAINSDVSGGCLAYILDSTCTDFLSGCGIAGTSTWQRAMTDWLYFPVGTKFYARAIFTDDNSSGLLSAPCL